MLPKKLKLSREQFPKHFERKITWSGDSLRVHCHKGEGDTKPSFAVVVSKKQYRTIVARNLFKRRVFSVIEKKYPALLHFQFDRYVIFPKYETEKITPSLIKADIDKLIAVCSK